ncbi:MAG TPA: hypothetical protein VK589_04445 [Chryseolinea sp.]|nr:hypothetical protein [Chryseolinea sp.]
MRIYRLINLLSLDVVAGAVVCALFFARVFEVGVRPFGLIALGLTVWIIYTADHLRDARKIMGEASTERHRFHQVHYRKLIILTTVALFLDVIAIMFIKQQVLAWGVALSFVVFAYLLVQGSLKFLKELFIAILYTCGILLLSVPVSSVKFSPPYYLLVVQFLIAALANLLMFSWFDRELDQQDKRYSFVTKAGEATTRGIVWFLLLLLLALTLTQFITETLLMPSLIVGCMGLMLLMIFIYRESLAKKDYYRLLGDAVFLVPVIYLLLI